MGVGPALIFGLLIFTLIILPIGSMVYWIRRRWHRKLAVAEAMGQPVKYPYRQIFWSALSCFGTVAFFLLVFMHYI